MLLGGVCVCMTVTSNKGFRPTNSLPGEGCVHIPNQVEFQVDLVMYCDVKMLLKINTFPPKVWSWYFILAIENVTKHY